MILIEVIDVVSNTIDALTDLAPKVVGFSAIIAAFFPPAPDGSFLSKCRQYINAVAFNLKYAANKE